jgi:hypothetical protein
MLAELLERWSQLEGDRCLPGSALEKTHINWLQIRGCKRLVRVFNHGNDIQSLAVIEYAVQQAIGDRNWVASYGFGPRLADGTTKYSITIYPALASSDWSVRATSAIGAEAWLSAYLQAIEAQGVQE